MPAAILSPTWPPTDNGWVVKGQVKDPAGNLLTLIQTRAEREAGS